MTDDNAVRGRETQPGTFAHRFSGKEGIEDVLQVLRLNAGASVAD